MQIFIGNCRLKLEKFGPKIEVLGARVNGSGLVGKMVPQFQIVFFCVKN